MHTFRLGDDVTVINDHLEVPGLGYLPVNAFVLHAREPVVVDTGLSLPDRDFVRTLSTIIDPASVQWIFLTHPDRDHTGGLAALLAAAPLARVVTTFLGVGIMSCGEGLPLNRVYLLNPGQRLEVGDRTLHAFRPALFDSPATVGFFDDRSKVCFSSDCFGAPLPSPEAAESQDVRAMPAAALREAQLLWAAVDSPWVHNVEIEPYVKSIRSTPVSEAETVCSTHLPPAIGLGRQLDAMLADAPLAGAFVGPDQKALEQMLAGFQPAAAPG
jgi:glyoxylase-like metal-dependent hydrolase (beta-lactamase superfamily II)